MSHPAPHARRIAILLLIVSAAAGAWGEELATGQLEIRGAVLRVSPAFQEVAPGLATVVFTSLGELRPDQIPPGLRVEGDLSGPGFDEPLRLTTSPGDAFRIPGLNREGTYTLSGIRLVEGNRTISSAEPDTAEILVHRLVISSITSRALTPDEMDAYGIVIDADNYTAWHYTVGFQVEGGTVEIPFDVMLGPQGMTLLEAPESYSLPIGPELPEIPVPTVNTGGLEPIPRTLLDLPDIDTEAIEATPIPGFIIIPTDMAFLNQFFSVIMVVQNGALADSGLELRNLTGVLELSSDGLRQAETDPPTIPGEPVPVMDPGPDGEPGTSDDLIFIVAQARGQATWLVEGLREGQHRLTAHLTGEIHGLTSGRTASVEGKIPGVVVVRDPRFAMTFFHPNVVRTGEFYDFRVAVTNVSTTPVYDLSLELPTNAISGARLVGANDDLYDEIEDGDNNPIQRVAELLPGTTAMVKWKLNSLRTGRVVASAFNSSNAIDARFVFEIGVGELGIPLSPESIVLPPVVDALPKAVLEPAIELLGLAHSLANAPNGVEVDLPPVGEAIVMLRGTELAAAGQRLAFGEPLARSVVGFGLEWMGSTRWSPSFDVLRRQSRRGHQLENATASYLGARMEELGASEALAELEELAISGRPMVLVSAEGAGFEGGARLAMVGNSSGRTVVGQRSDVEFFTRDLEGGSILGLDSDAWSGEIGIVAVPVEKDGSWFEESYQVQLWGTRSGAVDIEAILVMPDGSTRRFAPSQEVDTGNGSLAFFNIGPLLESTWIESDSNGDSLRDWWEEIVAVDRGAPAPRVIRAGFSQTVNPVRSGGYRNVVLLLSQPVDGDAVAEIEAEEWLIDSVLDIDDGQGSVESFSRSRHGRSFRVQLDPRILVVTFSEPLNPHAELKLSSGSAPLPMVGGGELDISDFLIDVGEGLESGVVRGVVLGPDGGPLPHAELELYELFEICHPIDGCNWYPGLSDRVRADASGGFLFDAVRYRDEAIPSQHAAFTVRAVDPENGRDTRLVGRLPGDNQVRTLTLAMVGRGDVVGTLRKADGSALVNPVVIARSITNPWEGRQTEPDASGSFRLEDLPVGPVQVVAKDGPTYTSGTAQITAPGAEAAIELVLHDFAQPLAQVEGSVIDGETAQPIPDLDVYVIPAGYQGATHAARTDSNGLFSMEDVPPGIARFKAWSPTLGRYVGEVVVDLLGDAMNTAELVVRASATGTITGKVTLLSGGVETPVAGAYVVARQQGLFALADEGGLYDLSNLPLGQIDLEVWDPVTAASTTKTVDLTADGQVLVLDFVLREDQGLGSVTVNVANGSGSPEFGAEVALAHFGSGYGGRTGGDGSIRIEDVPPGEHDVLVRLGQRLARGKVKVLYPGHSAATNLILGGLVSATIRVEADTVGGGEVAPITPISYRVPGVTSTGRIGQVPDEGWTECELDPEGVCLVEDLPTNVGSLVAVASSGFYGPVSASMFIDGVDGRELVINFQAPGIVGGTVVRPGPEGPIAVAEATVELWITGTGGNLIALHKQPSQQDGTFNFGLVPRGAYSIRVYHPGHGIAWLNGNMGSGQVIDDLVLSLRGRAATEGQVALCFDKKSAKAGSSVRISMWPNGVPKPFISNLEIGEIENRVLDLELDEDDRASFMFAGQMVGTWTLSATSALHGSAYETVGLGPAGETTLLAEPVCLHPTGTVGGTVTLPENGEPVESVTVQLFRRVSYYYEILTTESTAADGTYLFSSVPVGRDYQVRAFHTASNRGGISATVSLCDSSNSGFGTTCVRDAVLDVSLSPMGRLEGILRDQYQEPVEGGQIKLRTSVVLNQNGQVQQHQREWTAFTGADGGFVFEGVSAGTAVITAFDPDSPLFVEATVSINPVTSPTTTIELELPETAEIAVRVLDPFGVALADEVPSVAFQQSSHDFFREPSGSSPTVQHLSMDVAPVFENVVSGRFKVGACLGACESAGVEQILGRKFTTALGAVSESWMSNPPSDQVVELELMGRAAIAVAVTQGGEPVVGAKVRITGSGFYGRRDVTTQTGDDGSIIPVSGLGVGTYTVTAALTDPTGALLGGSREIEISQEDHSGTISVEMAIELSASAEGRTLDPMGQPAAGALVKMIFSNRTFQAVSDETGWFTFPSLAANQTYQLEAYAANGLGRHSLRDIVVATDHLILADLVLDETNPWVASIEPVNGGQDADPTADIIIDFSERMRLATLVGGNISLRQQGSGSSVPFTRSFSEEPDPDGDGPLEAFTRVTLAHGPLVSETLYLIDVLDDVEDLAGRRPSFDLHSTFRTRDTIPPSVLGAVPVDDPDGDQPVGPDVVPIISCSESMDPESLSATTVRLLDAGGQPVEAVLDLQRDGFDIRIRPATALELDTFYTVIIDGVTDAAGLALAEAYSFTFRVRDIEAPVITLLLPEGAMDQGGVWTALEGREITVLAAVTSNDSLRSVVLTVDGVPLMVSPDAIPGRFRGTAMMPVDVPSVVLGAAAEDVSGNVSEIASRELMVVDDRLPTGTIGSEPSNEVLPNHLLTVTIDFADDHGLASAYVSTTGVIEQEWTVVLSGTTGSDSREYRIPFDAVAGEQLLVSCEVEDTLEQRSSLTPLVITVAGDTASPTLSVTAPDFDLNYRSGQQIEFQFELEDEVAVESASLEIDGQTVAVEIADPVLPGPGWTAAAAAIWTVSETDEARTVPWTLSAVDPAGNTGTLEGTLSVIPAQGPDDPVVSFLCPRSGDYCLPDSEVVFTFAIDDDDEVQYYSILVDGEPVLEEVPLGETSWMGEFLWTPPADATAGDDFVIRIVARDWNGNEGSASAILTVPYGTVLTGERELLVDHLGEDLILGPGTHTAATALRPQNLTLLQGATLISRQAESLILTDLGVLDIRCGGAIDVTGLGYSGGETHPSATLADDARSAGSHLGEGSSYGTPGSTYGSVYRPQEFGGGSRNPDSGLPGGGVVRILADSVRIADRAAISANGSTATETYQHGAAGGSIWITAGTITGEGVIEARGGNANNRDRTSAGGGAVALEYGEIDDEIVGAIRADGGYYWRAGGAGTVYLQGPDSIFGDLVVDNAGYRGRYTLPPTLGSGSVLAGSGGQTLVTDRDQVVPQYFVGHWVEVLDSDENESKGKWRVASVDGFTLTLDGDPEIIAGDLWRGVYRFDSVTVRGEARVRFYDHDDFGSVDVEYRSILEEPNDEAPSINPETIVLSAFARKFWIEGFAGAVTDPDGVNRVTVVNDTAGTDVTYYLEPNGSFFRRDISGASGDEIRLEATDSHYDPFVGEALVGTLPANDDAPTIDPSLVSIVNQDGQGLEYRYRVDGLPGAITDENWRVDVTVRNVTAGISWSQEISSVGNFSIGFDAEPGETLLLEATDQHPEPKTSVLDLGGMPDFLPPGIDAAGIGVLAFDFGYWLVSEEPVIFDDSEIDVVFAIDPEQPENVYPLQLRTDGGIDLSPVSDRTGAVLEIVARDEFGNESRVPIPEPLPQNFEPPMVRDEYLSLTANGTEYVVGSIGSCSSEDPCGFPLESFDGVSFARLENRTTAIFEDVDLVLEEASCTWDCGTFIYGFEGASIQGAVGDEIWLVVGDQHPQSTESEQIIWALPQADGSPSITLSEENLIYLDGDYRLRIPAGGVIDPDGPVDLFVSLWRALPGGWVEVGETAATILSGNATDILLPGGLQGDLVILRAFDSVGMTTTVNLGALPEPGSIFASFDSAIYEIAESAGGVRMTIELSEIPTEAVEVQYRTIDGTAEGGADFEATEGTLLFEPGRQRGDIVIRLVDDDVTEGSQSFRVELLSAPGIEVREPIEAEVVITDVDAPPVRVTYSVGVDPYNFLVEPIDLSIVHGQAVFETPLPDGPDVGDQVFIDGLEALFIGDCESDTRCRVHDALGRPPADIAGVTATAIAPAFGSLEAAMWVSADNEHLGTYDLVSVGRSLEILCYGGAPDVTPVRIENWVTSPTHDIRIAAPDSGEIRGVSQRHEGRWSDSAYRLSVFGYRAIWCSVGNVTIEGLQFRVQGDSQTSATGIFLDSLDGTVDLNGLLIQIEGGETSYGMRNGVVVSTAAVADLVLRNSVIHVTDGVSNSQVFAVDVTGVDLNFFALNNTVVGAGYGFNSRDGSITAINNLAVGCGPCFVGEFVAGSANNIATDGSAPNPPAGDFGPVAFLNGTPTVDADYHLACTAWDLVQAGEAMMVHNFNPYDVAMVFDNNADTLAVTEAINPAVITVEFSQPRMIAGTGIRLSNADSHDWMVEAAMRLEDLDPPSGSYIELVDRRDADNTERMATGVDFEAPVEFKVIRLTVWRTTGQEQSQQYVHLVDWWLEGLNTACGQGVDLSEYLDHPFAADMDRRQRVGSWDIGADQSAGLTVGFEGGPYQWWETEGAAQAQVLLSEPAKTEVTVRFKTFSGSALEGEDFIRTEGRLIFEPGEYLKIVHVPLVNDGLGDEFEDFSIELFNPSGARLAVTGFGMTIREGAPPPRVSLSSTLIDVPEDGAVVTVGLDLSRFSEEDVMAGWAVFDRSTRYTLDYGVPEGEWPEQNTVFESGATHADIEFLIFDDSYRENDEFFILRPGGFEGAEPGVPSVGYVRILDDDGGAP